jgi:phosphoribulokinase
MPRPVMLGIVGDSGSGKTTITRGLVRVLGEDQVTHFCADDYHRYDRRQRAERGITPLDPDCNHLDILAQHLKHLRANDPVMKPVYRHTDGTFGAPVYVNPARFVVTEGLLAFQNKELCDMFDVRVYLAPPEELRRQWKVQRDCSRRGYTTDQVLSELDRREPDSEAFIRPQRERADIVVSFQPGTRSDADHLDARLTLRHTLPQPDLADFVGNEVTLVARDDSLELNVPGTISTEEAAQIEEAIWERLHFARHLRTQRLGEFTVGTALHRSDALGLVQLLILYHVVTARAVVALGGESARPFQLPTGDELVDEIFGEESAAL